MECFYSVRNSLSKEPPCLLTVPYVQTSVGKKREEKKGFGPFCIKCTDTRNKTRTFNN